MMAVGELVIRRLTGLDAVTLEALERIGLEALGDSALDHWMLPVVARCGMLYAGVVEGEIVGGAEVLRCLQEGDLYLEGLYISPAHQGRGHGARLLTHVIEASSQAGYRRLLATVDPENEAGRRLYGKAGFRETGWLPDHYGPGRHRLGIELELDVRP